MAAFDHIQHRRSLGSAPADLTQSLLQPSRQFAPLSTTTSQQDTPITQAQFGHAAPLQFSIKHIPIFPPERETHTGLPDNLKAGIENLSGISLDDVRVHYNSSKPAELQALAYTQGTEINIGGGQEKHLPHEAWHVVQQKQGRVRPTTHIKGVAVNEERRLEKEASAMGIRANQGMSQKRQRSFARISDFPIEQGRLLSSSPVQYLKADAEQYIADNKLDLEKVNQDNVTAYINDKNNPAKHRAGLSSAWIKGQNARFSIDEPDDLASSSSEYESDEAEEEENNPTNLSGTLQVIRSKGKKVSLLSFAVSPSKVKMVGYAQRKRPRNITFAATHPTEPELSGEFTRGPFDTSDFVYYPHGYQEGVPKRGQHGPTFGDLSGSAERTAKRLKTEKDIPIEDARKLVSEQIYGQTRGEEFDAQIDEKEKAPMFHFGQVLLADKARSFDASGTIQEALAEHSKSFTSRFPDDYKVGAYLGSGKGGRERLRAKRDEESGDGD